jgi:hypothetical protein
MSDYEHLRQDAENATRYRKNLPTAPQRPLQSFQEALISFREPSRKAKARQMTS